MSFLAEDAPTSASSDQGSPRMGWRYSLSSLLILTLVVAAFLAGRISRTDWRTPDLAGSYIAQLPAGFAQPTTLKPLAEGRWRLTSRAGIFNGIYAYRQDQLIAVQLAKSSPQSSFLTGERAPSRLRRVLYH